MFFHVFMKYFLIFCYKLLIMNGDRIKIILKEHKVKITELAQMLGESQSNTSALLSGTDVKTGLLERISAATGIPISEFFGEKTSLMATMHGGTGNKMIAGSGNTMGSVEALEVKALEQELELMKKWMAEKDERIKASEEKITQLIGILQGFATSK